MTEPGLAALKSTTPAVNAAFARKEEWLIIGEAMLLGKQEQAARESQLGAPIGTALEPRCWRLRNVCS